MTRLASGSRANFFLGGIHMNLTQRIEQTRKRIRHIEQRIREMEDEVHKLKMQLVQNTTARGNSRNLFDPDVERYLFSVSSTSQSTTKQPSKSVNLGGLNTTRSSRRNSSTTSSAKSGRSVSKRPRNTATSAERVYRPGKMAQRWYKTYF